MEIKQPTENIENRCNCNDEFISKPCPIHFGKNEQSIEKEGEKIIITDNNMVKEEVRQWAGFVYYCPICKKPSIMDTMNFCGNCGIEIIFHSTKLTNFIKELSKRYGGQNE